VTRFGKISPLWQEINLWSFYEALFSIFHSFEPTLANVYAIGQIFIVANEK